MKKKMLIVFASLVVLALVSSPVFAADKHYTIGVVIPYEIGWFTAFHKGFDVVAKAEGVDVKWAYNNYKADDEVKAIQNLIALGVDAINLTAVTPESAQYSCQLANDAKIPIQITESGTGEGRGKPIAVIDFDWKGIYVKVADSLRKDIKGPLSVLWLQGFAGTPPVMMGIEGFKSEIAKLKGIKLATDVQYGDYAVEKSLNVTNAIIQSGLKFNVAMGASQEIADGIITALKAANMRNKVKIVSVNGGPMDVSNFEKGNLDYCLSLSPGLHGMITAANLIAYLKGETYQTHTYSPIVWVNQKDWKKDLITWNVDDTWLPVVREFVKTGKYHPELKSKM
jgi:ABC-type sugar transport system substrate-binding protein